MAANSLVHYNNTFIFVSYNMLYLHVSIICLVYLYFWVCFVRKPLAESMFRLAAVRKSRKELPEELPELCVEDGVDDGVEGTVDVAQPGHDTSDAARDFALLAESPHRVHYEEWRPAEQEGTWRSKSVR